MLEGVPTFNACALQWFCYLLRRRCRTAPAPHTTLPLPHRILRCPACRLPAPMPAVTVPAHSHHTHCRTCPLPCLARLHGCHRATPARHTDHCLRAWVLLPAHLPHHMLHTHWDHHLTHHLGLHGPHTPHLPTLPAMPHLHYPAHTPPAPPALPHTMPASCHTYTCHTCHLLHASAHHHCLGPTVLLHIPACCTYTHFTTPLPLCAKHAARAISTFVEERAYTAARILTGRRFRRNGTASRAAQTRCGGRTTRRRTTRTTHARHACTCGCHYRAATSRRAARQ